jgi:hypothetical protein
LLDITQDQLSGAAHVALGTISDFEAGRLFIGGDDQIKALRRTLEEIGVEFMGFGDRVGVKLKGLPR